MVGESSRDKVNGRGADIMFDWKEHDSGHMCFKRDDERPLYLGKVVIREDGLFAAVPMFRGFRIFKSYERAKEFIQKS